VITEEEEYPQMSLKEMKKAENLLHLDFLITQRENEINNDRIDGQGNSIGIGSDSKQLIKDFYT
jgi:hypothetical protein